MRTTFAPRNLRRPRLLAITSLLSAAGLLTGCAPMNPAKDANYHAQANEINRPVVRPTRSISSFSDSLMCMDHLFRETGMSTVLITSKTIPDYSGKIAVATKEMIVTALSQMSRVSNAFRFVDYEVNIAQQDTVQNLTTLLLNNNQIRLQRPALYVSGAVAFVDQQVIANNVDMGTSASRLETGYSQSRRSSVIGMELHLGDFRSRTIIPGLDSANEIVIGSGGQGLDLSGRIGNYGVQFNVGRDYTQGSGPAIRTLVELAMIELLGKWARVPYWQCLTLEQTHPEFMRQMREWYEDASPATRGQLVRRSLLRRGYLPTENPDDATLHAALARFQTDERMVVTGVVDFPTYERSLRNFVTLSPDGHLQRIGWEAAPNQTAGAATAATTDKQGQPPEVDLQVENIMLGRSGFEQGEQIFLSATVSRSSYLSCYMRNARNEVIRILPNATNKSGWVPGNQAVRIPDWMSPTPGFVMDAGLPGQETVGCFASDKNVSTQLPESLQKPAFQPLPGITSMEQIATQMREAAGTGATIGLAQLQWEVTPKRPTAPGN
ncbi:DUF4384 domain-containing protein [Comamonas terrigena]|uniref:DUF4384 domain-containing protein n=1 Tax=Comamonas terrigena TaxID=32013 RepID=UPI00244836A6|nr:DUF4384 domain-containing protein [Comamonas terrigena]MDH1700678.1 DUF4384 domain-containing protein [Comamonas terrigena]